MTVEEFKEMINTLKVGERLKVKTDYKGYYFITRLKNYKRKKDFRFRFRNRNFIIFKSNSVDSIEEIASYCRMPYKKVKNNRVVL